MRFYALKDLQRRVAGALRIATHLRQQTRSLLGRAGPARQARDAAPISEWARIHGHLTQVLTLLDSGFSDAELRLARSKLVREATCACAYLRLRQTDPLRASLHTMLIDAMQLPISGDTGDQALQLRRSIRLALALSLPDSR